MSTCFNIFPTTAHIPKCKIIIETAVSMFNDFLRSNEIDLDVEYNIREMKQDGSIIESDLIVHEEGNYTSVEINGIGTVLLFYGNLTNVDFEMWEEEIAINKKAELMWKKILLNKTIGHYWQVKRTMGQPALIGLIYGFIAISIAKHTNGYIYSDDGAWSYDLFPSTYMELLSQYSDVDSITDNEVRSTVRKWIDELKIVN